MMIADGRWSAAVGLEDDPRFRGLQAAAAADILLANVHAC
jgi:hypothetical protein